MSDQTGQWRRGPSAGPRGSHSGRARSPPAGQGPQYGPGRRQVPTEGHGQGSPGTHGHPSVNWLSLSLRRPHLARSTSTQPACPWPSPASWCPDRADKQDGRGRGCWKSSDQMTEGVRGVCAPDEPRQPSPERSALKGAGGGVNKSGPDRWGSEVSTALQVPGRSQTGLLLRAPEGTRLGRHRHASGGLRAPHLSICVMWDS